jgi:hypothetical protein
LTEDSGRNGKVLLFGDLAYETIMKIFGYSERHDREQYLEWDLLLAPHHCSKKVMYLREDGADVLKIDILEALERHAREGAVVVASSRPIPTSDAPNTLPPHRKAAERYMDYSDRFICTMEWPSVVEPLPVILGIGANGAEIVEHELVELSAKSVRTAGRHRLGEVAAAATSAGRFASAVDHALETPSNTGTEKVRAAVVTDRGSREAPTTAVGFGRGQ